MKSILIYLSKIYELGLRLRRACYRTFSFKTQTFPATVISVGNITWGGTGKTPLILFLCQALTSSGKKPAVITRGYAQDELALMRQALGKNVPILAGKDRVKSSKQAISEHGANFLILDDGFQHWKIKRDLDIVLVNSLDPFGNGHLIPAGSLREPVANLSRAHMYILTKANLARKKLGNLKQQIQTIKSGARIYEANHKPVSLYDVLYQKDEEISWLRNRKVVALSAIGDPFSFEKTLEISGIDVIFASRYEDHSSISEEDLKALVATAQKLQAGAIVTTRKDFMRLESHIKTLTATWPESLGFYVLDIDFELNDEEDFIRRCLNPQRC